MSEPRSVLAGAVAETGQTIRIRDAGPVGQVTLRGDLRAEPFAAALGEVAGLEVPGVWQARFGADGAAAIWMSPDELLLLADYDAAPELVGRLGRALSGEHHLALNVSDARAVFDLTGMGVAEVLAKGAPVDLSPAAFPVGSARRTHLGGIAVVFWRRGEEHWQIASFRSFGRHLFDWLVSASRLGGEVGVF